MATVLQAPCLVIALPVVLLHCYCAAVAQPRCYHGIRCDLSLHNCCTSETAAVLPRCCRTATALLLQCCCTTRLVLHYCYATAIVFAVPQYIWHCYSAAAALTLHRCTTTLLLLHSCCTATALLLYYCSRSLQLSYCSYTAAAVLLQLYYYR